MTITSSLDKAYGILLSLHGNKSWEAITQRILTNTQSDRYDVTLWVRYIIGAYCVRFGDPGTELCNFGSLPYSKEKLTELNAFLDDKFDFQKVLNDDNRSDTEKYENIDSPSIIEFKFEDFDLNSIEFLLSKLEVSDLDEKLKAKLLNCGFLRFGELVGTSQNHLKFRYTGLGIRTINGLGTYLAQHGFELGQFKNWPSEKTILKFMHSNDLSDRTYFSIKLQDGVTIEENLIEAITGSLHQADSDLVCNRHGLGKNGVRYSFSDLAQTDYFSNVVSRQRVQQVYHKLENVIKRRAFTSSVLNLAEKCLSSYDFLTEDRANQILKNKNFTKSDRGVELLMSAKLLGIHQADLSLNKEKFIDFNVVITPSTSGKSYDALGALKDKLKTNTFVKLNEYASVLNSYDIESVPGLAVLSTDTEDFVVRIYDDLDGENNITINTIAKIFCAYERFNYRKLHRVVINSRTNRESFSEAELLQYLLLHDIFKLDGEDLICIRRPRRNRLTAPDYCILNTFIEYGEILDKNVLEHQLLKLGKNINTISQILMFNTFLTKISRGNVNQPAKYELVEKPRFINIINITNHDNSEIRIEIPINIALKIIGEFDISSLSIQDGEYGLFFKDGTLAEQIAVRASKILNLQKIANNYDGDTLKILYDPRNSRFTLK